eukprot:c20624_g1_i1 orf=207-899(+)
MGSEGASSIVIHVTGFKRFHGVGENPTEVIARRLMVYLQKRGVPLGLSLGSCTVLETAGDGALNALLHLLDSAVPKKAAQMGTDNPSVDCLTDNNVQILWIHLGVNSGASKFAIERRAVNEATFRCPDELGWQPQRIPIIPDDGDISFSRETTIPVQDIVEKLSKEGYDVVASDDAGRFVCNYVYYHSLWHSSFHQTSCLFVHVPLFSKIEEDIQMQFIASLLDVLAATV